MTKKYRITYESNDETFVLHRKEEGITNMEFRMHLLVLHMYHTN